MISSKKKKIIPSKKTKKINNTNLTKNLLEKGKVSFKKEDLIAEGAFGQVYKLRINNKLYSDYVVKYIKPVLEYQILNNVVNKLSLGRLNAIKKVDFYKEIRVLKEYQNYKISPQLIYTNDEPKNLYYIMEKLDKTLLDMIIEDILEPNHIEKLIQLFKRYLRQKYRHSDLHSNNIMYSYKYNDFRFIDWGLNYTLKNKKMFEEINNKHPLYYNDNKDIHLNSISLCALEVILEDKCINNPKKWNNITKKFITFKNKNKPEIKMSWLGKKYNDYHKKKFLKRINNLRNKSKK